MRSGQKIPARIQNAPELLFGLEFYFQAFQDLQRERPAGMGLSPIPFQAMISYSKWLNLTPSEEADLIVHVRALDQTFLEFHRKKSENG